MRYIGSKRRIADEILPIMLDNDRSTFVDAFCGGCSVIERVPSTYRRIANDKNKYLIAMWRSLLAGQRFPSTITKKMYYHARMQASGKIEFGYSDDEIGWIGFMSSFNGKFFQGYTGHNVVGKDGKVRDYIAEYIANIKKDIAPLRGVEFVEGSYDCLDLPPRSIVYCDIPYEGRTGYRYGKFNYEAFYAWCKSVASAGHKVFVSEYHMPDDFTCVWEKEVTNSLNPVATKRPVERLFTLK